MKTETAVELYWSVRRRDFWGDPPKLHQDSLTPTLFMLATSSEAQRFLRPLSSGVGSNPTDVTFCLRLLVAFLEVTRDVR
jgi:hypothetical protein